MGYAMGWTDGPPDPQAPRHSEAQRRRWLGQSVDVRALQALLQYALYGDAASLPPATIAAAGGLPTSFSLQVPPAEPHR